MKARISTLAVVALMCVGGYAALFIAPTEKTQGDVQRIFYFHLPSWIAMFIAFFIAAYGNVAYLMTRKMKWDWLGVSAVEVGVACCTIGLITGPLWGKPVWGIWWTWDARLTSTFMLWFLYVSYLILRNLVEEPESRARLTAVFGLFAFVDVPFVYLSTRLFRTEHPGPVIGGGADSGLDPRMANVLLVCMVAFVGVALVLLVKRYRLEQLRFELEELRTKVEYESVVPRVSIDRPRIQQPGFERS